MARNNLTALIDSDVHALVALPIELFGSQTLALTLDTLGPSRPWPWPWPYLWQTRSTKLTPAVQFTHTHTVGPVCLILCPANAIERMSVLQWTAGGGSTNSSSSHSGRGQLSGWNGEQLSNMVYYGRPKQCWPLPPGVFYAHRPRRKVQTFHALMDISALSEVNAAVQCSARNLDHKFHLSTCYIPNCFTIERVRATKFAVNTEKTVAKNCCSHGHTTNGASVCWISEPREYDSLRILKKQQTNWRRFKFTLMIKDKLDKEKGKR